ncbi:putative TMhelix containing protein [Vibrio phage 242E40-1]|nr:putative TMhelix containing protein [Vibrio phage 242E40-1]
MEILGWVISVVVASMMSLMAIGCSIYCLGAYNIGGVPFTWKDRIWIPFAALALYYLWGVIHDTSPFTVIVN